MRILSYGHVSQFTQIFKSLELSTLARVNRAFCYDPKRSNGRLALASILHLVASSKPSKIDRLSGEMKLERLSRFSGFKRVSLKNELLIKVSIKYRQYSHKNALLLIFKKGETRKNWFFLWIFLHKKKNHENCSLFNYDLNLLSTPSYYQSVNTFFVQYLIKFLFIKLQMNNKLLFINVKALYTARGIKLKIIFLIKEILTTRKKEDTNNQDCSMRKSFSLEKKYTLKIH
ncbi:hypothetical protein BpHYR1_010576 [Brachionus plicatilis]|uniref:Uncharacterized protein n=1 Tax=Brachionus plicatilis TaxID=10195 RepID=A0A3M7QKV1_BRAPC|nr:hypothetical protein BpHYR1_010576 [Brachionus plicatilis]